MRLRITTIAIAQAV